MAHAIPAVPPPAGERPFEVRLPAGPSVRVQPISPDAPVPSSGDPALRELRGLIAAVRSIGPTAAAANGISLPTAWVATAVEPPQVDLGIAWWTPLPWHRATAIAELALAPGDKAAPLGQVLLELLVLSAEEQHSDWLQVRLPAGVPGLAEAITRFRGRPLEGEPGRYEIPLGPGHRRYHRSGVHRLVRKSDRRTPEPDASAPSALSHPNQGDSA